MSTLSYIESGGDRISELFILEAILLTHANGAIRRIVTVGLIKRFERITPKDRISFRCDGGQREESRRRRVIRTDGHGHLGRSGNDCKKKRV